MYIAFVLRYPVSTPPCSLNYWLELSLCYVTEVLAALNCPLELTGREALLAPGIVALRLHSRPVGVDHHARAAQVVAQQPSSPHCDEIGIAFDFRTALDFHASVLIMRAINCGPLPNDLWRL